MSDVTLEVRAAAASYTEAKTVGGNEVDVRRTALRGQKITVDKDQAESLIALGVCKVAGTTEPETTGSATPGASPIPDSAQEAITAAGGVANLTDEEKDEDKGEDPVAPAPTDTTSVVDLIKKIDAGLNAKDTVALAAGDPGMAKLVLEAENSRDGEARKTVVGPLTELIEADAGSGDN